MEEIEEVLFQIPEILREYARFQWCGSYHVYILFHVYKDGDHKWQNFMILS